MPDASDNKPECPDLGFEAKKKENGRLHIERAPNLLLLVQSQLASTVAAFNLLWCRRSDPRAKISTTAKYS